MATEQSVAMVMWLMLALSMVGGVQGIKLVGVIHMKGITATVTFQQLDSTQNAVISISSDNSGSFALSLHEFPVMPDTPDSCNEKYIGKRILEKFDGLIDKSQEKYFQVDVSTPEASILGRTVRLIQINRVLCATLLPDTKMTTLTARFTAGVGGSVVFRQDANDPTTPVSILTNLFWLRDPSADSQFGWFITRDPRASSGACPAIDSEVFDASDMQGCAQKSHKDCPMGDLSAKLGNVKVSQSGAKSFFLDANLNLQKVEKSMILMLKHEGKIVSCANIDAYSEHQATAEFSDDGVTGYIKFSQLSPYDVTKVQIDLGNLRNLAGGYHVHKFPTPARLNANSQPCSAGVVSGHLNPYGVVQADGPKAGTGTHDEFEIGDLSGKYGGLASSDDFKASYEDYNLPMFGRNSIIGRSLVIHYAAENKRWICSNIRVNVGVRTAVATFTDKVVGFIRFEQIIFKDTYEDTAIYAELKYADGTPATANHNWHFHINKVKHANHDAPDSWDLNNDEKCQDASGHYNPHNVSVGKEYASLCSPDNPLRCEVGDLSSKLVTLNIAAATDKSPAQTFTTDSSLPQIVTFAGGRLSIASSNVGHSVVIHVKDKGAPSWGSTRH